MDYDIIGDIHGHADALKALLRDMGYRDKGGAWRHADRQAIFLGDLIDRGPHQVEAVEIVRRMVDAQAQAAQAVMGNHEFNAIAWFTPDTENDGEYLRPHHSPKYGNKNFRQHEAFLAEVDGTPRHREIVDWFLTLPLWLELDAFRVVHACWHPRFVGYLGERAGMKDARLTPSLLVEACREPQDEGERDTPEPSVFKAVEALIKGLEIPLPDGNSFRDKDGHERTRVRVRWWDREASTYRQSALRTRQRGSSCPRTQYQSTYDLRTPGASRSSSAITGNQALRRRYRTAWPALTTASQEEASSSPTVGMAIPCSTRRGFTGQGRSRNQVDDE